jgi:hypothetical protein
MRHDVRMDQANVHEFGVLPAFGGNQVGARDMEVNPFGQGSANFRPKEGFAPVRRAPPAKMKPSRDIRSPTTQMGPWGSAAEREMMGRAFDPSASAPGYRPNKVIRSLDDSFRAKKPRAHTVNPRLNAVEVTMMRSSPEVRYEDVEVMQLSGDLETEYEYDPLLGEPANLSELQTLR